MIAVRSRTSARCSSGSSLRAALTFGPAMWAWMSTPPGMTTIPRASMRAGVRGHVGDDLAVLHADVAHLAVDAVGGVVDAAAGDPQHHSRPAIAASTSSAARPVAVEQRAQRDRHAVHAVDRARDVDAVGGGGEGDARRPRRLGVARVDDHRRQLAQAPAAASSASQRDHERGVDLAALEQRGRAELAGVRARVAAREAHRRRVAGLPGEHVLGAARVAVAAQRQRDGVRDRGQVAHEREQRERRDARRARRAGTATWLRRAGARRARRARRAAARPRGRDRAARSPTSARSAHSASKSCAASSATKASASSAVAVRCASTTTSVRDRGGAIQAQALEQARVGE